MEGGSECDTVGRQDEKTGDITSRILMSIILSFSVGIIIIACSFITSCQWKSIIIIIAVRCSRLDEEGGGKVFRRL